VAVGFLIAAASFLIPAVRIGVLDLIGPVMPLRSNEKGRRPSPRREAIRVVARLLAVLSATAAMVNILEQRRRMSSHSPVQYESYENYAKDAPATEQEYNWDYDEDGSPWHHDVLPLLLRWKEGVTMPPEAEVLAEVSQALEAGEDNVYVQDTLEKSRVMLFGFAVGKDESQALATKWTTARAQGKIGEWADLDFPSRLDAEECETLLEVIPDNVMPDEENRTAGAASDGTSRDSREAEPAALTEVKKAVCQAYYRWLGHYDMDEGMGDMDLYGDYDTEGRFRGDEDMMDDDGGGGDDAEEALDAGDAEMGLPDAEEAEPDDM